MTEFVQITTVTDSSFLAESIASELVERRHAGCVQVVGPIQSIYRWQGNVERSEEWLCVIKTSRDQYLAVETLIRQLHSYECPEIIATAITTGSDQYLAWLAEQVSSSE